ncbi:MAG: PorV/PorQ family protein [Bacteroidota bacterium]
MNRITRLYAVSVVVSSLCASHAFGQAKLAQTGFNFLSVGTDARATSMGEAFTTIEGSSVSLFYNPAGLAGIESFVDLSLSHLKWIADIKYLAGTVAFSPFEGRYGVIGVSFMGITYGDFKFTQVAANEQGYQDIEGWPSPSAYVIGIGYGRALSDQFSVGGQVKYAHQSLGQSIVPAYRTVVVGSGQTRQDTTYELRDYSVGTLAFDFGTLFKTGLKSLAFGVAVNNFAQEIKYERESFQLPLSFKFGISMNLLDLVPDIGEDHSFVASVDAVHPRSYDEFLNIGGEYIFSKTIAARIGYITNHPEYGLTAGIGLQKAGIAIDYSYMPHKIFNNIQRLSVKFSL